MQTRKNANLAPESFRRSTVPRRLKHRARRRRRILCLLPVILVFGVLAAALLRFTPALAYADIFPAQATTRRIKDVPYISQLPTLPTGCESASAAMLLNYYGCTVTAEEFASYSADGRRAAHGRKRRACRLRPMGGIPRRPVFGNRLGMLLHRH